MPHPDLFVYMYVRKEAVLSSQIEGTQSSLHDLLRAEAELFHRALADDVDEVVNYVAAMKHGLERLAELPVSVRLIREIHERLLRGVRGGRMNPGELRRIQNWIGPQGCTMRDATFVPPPPQTVSDLLTDLEKYLHSESDLPILIRIGLAHAQFETIHPFLDGNGRVGRLLITFLLTEREVLREPVLYLSHHFKRHRQRYYDLLQAVRDEGDWESWLVFFLEGVEQVSSEAVETAGRILQMREEHRDAITSCFGSAAGNGLKILESLYRRPIVSVSQVQDLLESSYPTANALVGRLVELEILEEVTGQKRNRRYRYSPYVRLFTE